MGPKKLLCPKCSSLLVARTDSATLRTDRTAAYTVPTFDCRSCGHRFQAALQDAPPPEQPADRRENPRVSVRMPVNLECGAETTEATITDISKGGCAVESQRPLTVGQLLRLKFPPPTGSTEGLGTQKIATVKNVRGDLAGVRFLAFSDEEHHKLTQTVTKSIQFFPPQTK